MIRTSKGLVRILVPSGDRETYRQNHDKIFGHKVFIYATLKSKKIQEKALGHTKVEERAALPGFREIMVRDSRDTWPTLAVSDEDTVKGDIIKVSPEELEKLDRWESNYQRKKVNTSSGLAWTYIFKRVK